MPRILLVDDQAATGNTMAALLEAMGHEVQRASTAASAIALLSGAPGAPTPQMVVLDAQMHRLDGWQLLRWVQERGAVKAKDRPAVVVHSHLDEHERRLAMKLGAAEFWQRGMCSFVEISDTLERQFSPRVK